MKRERLFSCLTAAGLAFFTGLGGAACVATGFQLHVKSWTLVVLAIFAAAVLSALFFSVRRGPAMLLGVLVFLGLLAGKKLELGAESLLFRVSNTFNSAYSSPVIRWTGESPYATPTDLGLCLLALIPVLAVAFTVCRRKNAFFAVVAGFEPLALCMVVTDTVPAVWCLFLLLAALLLLMATNTVRRRSGADGLRLTARLLLPCMLAPMLLFWAVPQAGYDASQDALQQMVMEWVNRLSGQTEPALPPGPIFTPGGVSKMDLAGLGSRRKSPIAVMLVRTGQSGLLYLRGQAYDLYNGLSWDVTRDDALQEGGWPNAHSGGGVLVEITTWRTEPLLYFPYYLDEKQRPSPMDQGHIPNPKGKKNYSYVRFTYAHDESVRLPYALSDACLALPTDTWNRASAIVAELGLEPGTAPNTAARVIGNYVRNSARYSLTTSTMPKTETDFALWFLQKANRGYCVHFATAATVLLRAAGIPARFVTGYVARTQSGVPVTVTGDQAHAWVEYFVPNVGWMVLDPTPSDALPPEPTVPNTDSPTRPSGETRPSAETRPSDETQSSAETRPSDETQSSEETQAPSVGKPTRPTPSAGGSAPAPTVPGQQTQVSRRVPTWIIWTLLTAAALISGIWGQAHGRLARRRRRLSDRDLNRRTLAGWREAEKLCRLLKTAPPDSLRTLAEKAKYSPHTITPEEWSVFSAFLGECSAALQRLPPARRWLYRLLWAVE